MSYIDKLYLQKLEERGPMFAMRQCQGMIDSVKEMYRAQLRGETPGLEGRALEIAVARRIYSSDPATLQLLDRVEAADA